jgi:hypothetical protein
MRGTASCINNESKSDMHPMCAKWSVQGRRMTCKAANLRRTRSCMASPLVTVKRSPWTCDSMVRVAGGPGQMWTASATAWMASCRDRLWGLNSGRGSLYSHVIVCSPAYPKVIVSICCNCACGLMSVLSGACH